MIFEWAWSKMVKLFSSWDPKICCTLRMNLRIELIFWMLLYLLFSNGGRQKYRGHFVLCSLLHFFMFVILHHYFAKVASVTSTIIISLDQEDCSQIFQPRSCGKAGNFKVSSLKTVKASSLRQSWPGYYSSSVPKQLPFTIQLFLGCSFLWKFSFKKTSYCL